MTTITTAIVMLTALDPHAIAKADYRSLPAEDAQWIRYIEVTDRCPASVVNFTVLSFSRTVNVEAAMPRQLDATGSILRIDLRLLQWSGQSWMKLVERYPYHSDNNPLVVRGDWLVDQLWDETKNTIGRELLVGKNVTTVSELLEATGVDRAANRKLELTLGHIEGKSGIARQPERLIEFLETLGGYAAITHDYETLDGERAPTERLDLDDPQADASEVIIGLRKRWAQGSGVLQHYALVNGEGKLVAEAPVEIVEDATRTAGLPTVRSGLSCVSCHVTGLLPTRENRLQTLLDAGVLLQAKYEDKVRIESDFLASVKLLIERAGEDYETAIVAITGMPPVEFVAEFRRCIVQFREPLTLPRVAAELHLEPEVFESKLRGYSDQYSLPGNLAALAHEQSITRDFAENQWTLLQLIADWESE